MPSGAWAILTGETDQRNCAEPTYTIIPLVSIPADLLGRAWTSLGVGPMYSNWMVESDSTLAAVSREALAGCCQSVGDQCDDGAKHGSGRGK